MEIEQGSDTYVKRVKRKPSLTEMKMWCACLDAARLVGSDSATGSDRDDTGAHIGVTTFFNLARKFLD